MRSRNTTSSLCKAIALFIVFAGTAAAAEPEWKVGLAQVKVTPEQPVLMAGYAARTKPFENAATDLYVNSLVLQDAEAHRAALVTSDLIAFPAAVAQPICERLLASTGP